MCRPNVKLGIEGHFRLRVFNAETGELAREAKWQRNLITNQGLDAIAQQSDVMAWYHVGTDSSAPAETDTWVGAIVASSNNSISDVNGVSGASPHYGYRRSTKRYDPGEATGNLSEVAVGWSATTGTAFSHELIRDDVGDPTTITVLSDEYLEFTYELRYYPPTGDATGTIEISGVEYNFTSRALNVTSTFWWSQGIGHQLLAQTGSESYHRAYTGNVAAITASAPAGTDATGTTSITKGSYISGTYQLAFFVSANTGQWNVAGGVIRSLVLGCSSTRWQCEFSKVSDGTGIPKSIGNSLQMNWLVSWDRRP